MKYTDTPNVRHSEELYQQLENQPDVRSTLEALASEFQAYVRTFLETHASVLADVQVRTDEHTWRTFVQTTFLHRVIIASDKFDVPELAIAFTNYFNAHWTDAGWSQRSPYCNCGRVREDQTASRCALCRAIDSPDTIAS